MKKYLLLLISVSLLGCGYKFNGASTDGLKTINVQFFENNAPLVEPTLSQSFTESLKNYVRNQSPLNVIQNDADATFTGNITGYEIRPIAIQDNARPTAGATRVTITVSVKYVDTKVEKRSFEKTFSQFADFPSGQSYESQKLNLIKQINDKLTLDIFQAAFSQW